MTATSYKYDGANRLIGRKDSGNNDVFIQSGWNIVTEKDDSQNRTYHTAFSTIKNGDVTGYFHYDHLGNTRIITDENGNITSKFSYEAYGTPIDENGIPINNLTLKSTPNLFVGAYGIKYDTKTNLNYMRYRWFSSNLLRFISPDLLMNVNRYECVNNSPITKIDILGKDPVVAGTGVWTYLSTVLTPASAAVGIGVGVAVIASFYVVSAKTHEAIARKRGVPDEQYLLVMKHLQELEKYGKITHKARMKAWAVIHQVVKTYSVHTNYSCEYAKVQMAQELLSAFAYDKDIVPTPKRQQPFNINVVVVRIIGMEGQLIIYTGADAVRTGRTIIQYEPIQFDYPD
jgi:RHS repeat-associated protein